MSDKYVLDASALLRFTDNKAGADEIQRLLVNASAEKAELLISAVNWGEVVCALARDNGLARGRQVIGWLRQLPVTLVSTGERHAQEAAWFRFRYKVPYADAYAGSLAAMENAVLVTADYHFTAVGTHLKINFLPVLRGKREKHRQ